MFDFLGKKLEELVADVNPLDNGKTGATIRANRNKPAPAQTVRSKPQGQRQFQSPFQSSIKPAATLKPTAPPKMKQPKMNDPVQEFNSMDVHAQRKKLADLQGLAGRTEFHSAEDVKNAQWAKKRLQQLEEKGQKKNGDFHTLAADFAGGIVAPGKQLVDSSIDTLNQRRRGEQLVNLQKKGKISRDQFNMGAQNVLKNSIDRDVKQLSDGTLAGSPKSPVRFGAKFIKEGMEAGVAYNPVGSMYGNVAKMGAKASLPTIGRGILREGSAYTVADTANDVIQGRGVTPESFLTNAAMSFGGAAVGAGGALAKPHVQSIPARAQNYGLKPPTNLTPDELYVLRRVQASRMGHANPQDITQQEMVTYFKAQLKLGAKPGTVEGHSAVDRALSAHSEFNHKRAVNKYKAQTTLDYFTPDPATSQGGFIAGPLAGDFSRAKAAGRVFEGVDGKPRFEVDDSGAKIKKSKIGYQTPLGEILDHPKLYEQYPELKNIKVTKDASDTSSFDLDTGEMRIGAYSKNPKSDILHEIQHAIQQKERFAAGGNLENGWDAYRNLAGEAEARAVASRMNMSDGERYVTPKTKAGDYVGSHKAPTRGDGDYHAPASDVTGGAGMFPDDIYTDPRAYSYYGHGGDAQGIAMDKKSIELIRALKNKPDAEVTMYRAVPKGKTNDINAGDWVTLNKDYAQLHNNSQFDGKGTILEQKVRADELYTDGNSIHEFGYDPKAKPRSTFYDSLDVPKEDLIVRHGDGVAMSAKDPYAKTSELLDPVDANYINEQIASHKSPEEYRQKLIDILWKNNKKGYGVDSTLVNGDPSSYDVTGRVSISNNSPFYQEFYKEYGYKPTKTAITDMVDQALGIKSTKDAVFKNLLVKTQSVSPFEADIYRQLKDRQVALESKIQSPTPFEQDLQAAGIMSKAKKTSGNKVELQSTQKNKTRAGTQQLSEQATQVSKTPLSQQVGEPTSVKTLPDVPDQSSVQKATKQQPASLRRQESQELRSYTDNTTTEVKKRGFTESVKGSDEVSPDVRKNVSGEYNVRSTDKLALSADKFSTGNLRKVTENVNERLATKKGNITDQDVADALAVAKRLDAKKQFDQSQAIYDKLAEHGTASGQTIQAFSLLKNRTPEGIKYQMLRNLKKNGVNLTDADQKEVGKLIDKVRKTKPNTEERNRALFETMDYVSKRIPSSNGDKIINFWRAGLLTAPKTTGGNIIGNTSELAARELWANPVAVATDKFFSIFTGKRTKTLSGGQVKGMKEGVEKGLDYMKTGYDPRNMTQKWDAPRRINYKTKVIDSYVNGVYRWMGTQDQPFYYGAKAAAAYDLAKADGMNLKLKGQELADYVEKSVADENWKPQTFKTANDVEGYARYAVYQNETLLGQMAKGVKDAADNKGLRWITDFILPFTQVPSSIAMRIIDRTPIGTAREVVKQIRKKSFDQRAMAEAIGNGSFGIPVIAAGYALAQNGEITGDYPTDSKERKLWEEEGKQPYSIRIGDKWYSLNYLQPFGTILNIGKNLDDQRKEGKSDSEAWMTAVGSAGQSVTDQSFLKGLNGVLSALNDPEGSLGQFAKSTASSTVPNFIRSFASATDDKQREIKDPAAAVQGSIPGLRQGLPEKQGMFGNTLERQDDAFNSYLNPLRPSKVKNESDQLLKELRRLQDAKNGIVTTSFDKNAIKDVELNENQVRDLNKQVNSMVQGEWNKAISDPRYSPLSDEDKNTVLKKIKDNVASQVKAEFITANGLKSSGNYRSSDSDPFGTKKQQGKKVSSRRGRRVAGGGRRGKAGKFDYKLFGFAESGSSNSKALYDLVKKAELKSTKNKQKLA